MEEKENESMETGDPETTKKKETEENPLPYCTTAPSAEHHRGADEDEPCDDGRTGDLD
jgi:hypothetical protein